MKHTLRLLLVLLVIVSCKDKSAEHTDNLFKFKDYISFNTNGRQSIVEPIRIGLAKSLEQYELNQEIDANLISIKPKVDGKLIVENSNTLIFQPSETLKPDTEYTVTVKLNKFYNDVPKDFKEYTFSFKTITPDFKINLGNLQSYSKDWQYLTATLQASDVLDVEDVKKVVEVSQKGNNQLKIDWNNVQNDAKYFSFKIDSIQRKEQNSEVLIKWDGDAVSSETEGENSYNIVGKDNFSIVNVHTERGANPVVSINFSDPLKTNQNFNGQVVIQNTQNPRFEVDGNVLNVYPQSNVVGNVRLEVFNGVTSTDGYKLKQAFSELVSFEQLKPAIRLVSKGVILPTENNTPFYFEAVNLKAVDVRIIKVYEDNVLQFLQNNNLSNTNLYDLKRVGRRIAKTRINLVKDVANNTGSWKAYGLDLSEHFEAESGALYQVDISFGPNDIIYDCNSASTVETSSEDDYYEDDYYYYDEDYGNSEDFSSADDEAREEAYWDNRLYNWRRFNYNWQERDNPCHPAYFNQDHILNANILGSDLGMTVKQGKNDSYRFIVTNINTARPEASAKVTLYNYQQQPIATVNTDTDGFAIYDGNKDAYFAVAQKNKSYAYVKLGDGNALTLSNFNVSGQELQEGLKGFLYTERGVHRPGDSIHLTFALDDTTNPLPANHPVVLEVFDARGKLTNREVATKSKNGFLYFPIKTEGEAETGNWRAEVKVGGATFTKSLKVETIKPNRLKIDLDFEDDILNTTEAIRGTVNAKWLHGAPARNLNVTMEANISEKASSFKGLDGYIFSDPTRSFNAMTMPVLDSQLNAEGVLNFSKDLNLGNKAPGMLQASFLTKVFEGGGDFSIDVFTKNVAPYSHFVGLKSPEPKRYGSFYTDENVNFGLKSVDAKGNSAGNRNLQVVVYKISWRWWWNRGNDNLSSYENASVRTAYKEMTVKTNANGDANFSLNIPEEDRGRFLIRIIDTESGHATGRTAYFYKNWWQSAQEGDSESSRMLVFSAEKESYQVGEKAKITFPSGSDGRALVSIENGTEVLDTKWIETQKGETTFNLDIAEEYAPNVYVNISLLQPHAQTKNDLPIRLYGVIPLSVEDPKTILKPQISMSETLKPETSYSVNVSEANGKAMTYTLAVVDDGLLDLTNFKTPDIHDYFYTKEALGVKTFDIYDDVIGAYSGRVDNIYTIGGGDDGASAKNKKADRFKPVVTYLGPFTLGKGESRSHNLMMPNYVGSVRAMVVAGNVSVSAYGNVDKTVPVKTPLMVLASVPRKLSPGEKVTIPVTVFAMENRIKSATISVETSDALRPIGSRSKTIQFSEVGEQIVNFEYDVSASEDVQTINVSAKGSGETASYELELDVFNPNPITTRTKDYEVNANASENINFETFGVPGSNEAMLEISTLPPIDFTKRLQYLIRYPYGCVEQTTSSAFPQLFVNDIMDLTIDKKQEIQKNVESAIKKLNNFQVPSGGLSYWPGEGREDEWSTNYAGHFMLEAKAKGYVLPLTFLSSWLRFQQTKARQWRATTNRYGSLTQAYRLYTLALAGQPEFASMNRLKEMTLSNDAKWRLASAYALAGQENVAREIAQTANINFTSDRYDYYTYGSVYRNQAMALEAMVILKDDNQRELATSIAKRLSSSRWLSTQETSYALMAMSKLVMANGGKDIDATIIQNGQNKTVKTSKTLATRGLNLRMGSNSIQVKNNKGNLLYVKLVQSGKLPLGEELAEQKNLAVKTTFLDGNGNPMDITSLRQGTEFVAKVEVVNNNDKITNVALSQIIPSGWEIVNTRFTDFGGEIKSVARYTDIRDDRVNMFFDLDRKKSKVFTIKLNASYLGSYYLPGTQAEAMYDNNYYARNSGKWIEVRQ